MDEPEKNESIEQEIASAVLLVEGNPELDALRQFYQSMQDQGLVLKHAYGLSAIDPVGIRLYQRLSVTPH
jgi:hypothetical protein